jgi:hypothetical protein
MKQTSALGQALRLNPRTVENRDPDDRTKSQR